MISRVVIFTADLNFAVRKGIISLLDDQSDINALVLVHRPSKHASRLIRNQIVNFRKNGWRWLPYQLREIFELVVSKFRRPLWRSESSPGSQYSIFALNRHPRLRITVFENIHCWNSIELVRKFRPDIGISLAAPILQESLYSTPKNGTINLHKGKVPQYRGMPPAFWELWNGESSVGCTVHVVEQALDTGTVLETAVVKRKKYSTPIGLRLELDEIGIEMMCKVVRDFNNDTVSRVEQSGLGITYRKPTLKQIETLRKRIDQFSEAGSLFQAAKAMGCHLYTHGMRPIVRCVNNIIGKKEIVILLYHRVSDEFRDGVTVGIEQFNDHMEFMSRRYPIASICDVVHGKVPYNTRGKPVICVTFDDGYLDNYQNAVPILVRHQIPAAFFVSTGVIGRKIGFQHDLDKIGYALPNMSWDNLREMQDLGFTIGSHTINHIDCAQANEDLLLHELSESKSVLQSKLGMKEVFFAYPFGGRQNMTSEALVKVREAGYAACFSAYGGVNRYPVQKFNILRMGVSAGFSKARFAARLEGW